VLALLLDIDGTLLDTFDAILEAMNAAIQEVGGRPLTAEELRPLIGMPVQRQMKLLRDIEGKVVEEITERYYEVFHALMDKGVRSYPGVAKTLAALAGRPITTMSTRRREEARHMLRVAGLEPFFTEVVGGDEVARPKPYPDLPRHAARALGVPVDRAVVVGDSPIDILAGRAAGAWTVAATYGYGTPASLREAKPHATISRFPELPAVLEELEPRIGADSSTLSHEHTHD